MLTQDTWSRSWAASLKNAWKWASWGTFCRYKAAVDEGGVEVFFDHTQRKPDLGFRIDVATEQAVIKSAKC